MPNLTAHIALLVFLPVAIWIFSRLPRAQATAVVVLSGSLLLPEQLAFDLPAVPPLGKEHITYLSLLVAALIYARGSVIAARPGWGLEALVVAMIAADIGTVLENPGAIWDEGRLEPGLVAYDVVSQGSQDILQLGLPFFLGRALFRTREDLRSLLVMLGAAGLVYTGLIAIEVVLSIPFNVFQLSFLLYGFSSGASFRWGVIQPLVFMDHGLSVATYMASSVLAVAGLAKARMQVFGVRAKVSMPLLLAGLVMCRNVAGVIYGATFGLFIAFVRPQALARISVIAALLVVVYPALRMAGYFPAEKILEIAGDFDEERERSLRGRFEEEEYVLALMGERMGFGWGNISRVPGAEGLGGWEAGGFEGGIDGYWVIRLGTHGAVGLELRLALLVLPVLVAWRRLRRLRSQREAALLAALMAIVAMRTLDLLPNGWWNDLPVFLAGALYGLSGGLLRAKRPARPRRPASAPGLPGGADSLRRLAAPPGSGATPSRPRRAGGSR